MKNDFFKGLKLIRREETDPPRLCIFDNRSNNFMFGFCFKEPYKQNAEATLRHAVRFLGGPIEKIFEVYDYRYYINWQQDKYTEWCILKAWMKLNPDFELYMKSVIDEINSQKPKRKKRVTKKKPEDKTKPTKKKKTTGRRTLKKVLKVKSAS